MPPYPGLDSLSGAWPRALARSEDEYTETAE